MKLYLSLLITLFTINFSQGQESEETTKVEEPKSLEDQFEWFYRTSSRFRGTDQKLYRTMSEQGFLNLKKQVFDTINYSKRIISEKEIEIIKQKNTISNIENDLRNTSSKLKESQNKEDSIILFGTKFSKTSYNLTLWSLVFLFLILSISFLMKFRNSNVHTKEAKERLIEVEQELEQFRKKTLVKEQKLRRQLQDEINKQK